MDSGAIANGYRNLAEAVIKCAIEDMQPGQSTHLDRAHACRFILDERWMDVYTGLAPHMIRDWEHAIPVARQIAEDEGIKEVPNG